MHCCRNLTVSMVVLLGWCLPGCAGSTSQTIAQSTGENPVTLEFASGKPTEYVSGVQEFVIVASSQVGSIVSLACFLNDKPLTNNKALPSVFESGFDTKEFQDGVATLDCLATDSNNNEGTLKRSFNIDNTEAAIDFLINGVEVNGGEVWSGTVQVEFRLVDSSGITAASVSSADDTVNSLLPQQIFQNQNSLSFTLNTELIVSSGSVSIPITVNVVDGAKNKKSDLFSFLVENDGTGITIVKPQPNAIVWGNPVQVEILNDVQVNPNGIGVRLETNQGVMGLQNESSSGPALFFGNFDSTVFNDQTSILAIFDLETGEDIANYAIGINNHAFNTTSYFNTENNSSGTPLTDFANDFLLVADLDGDFISEVTFGRKKEGLTSSEHIFTALEPLSEQHGVTSSWYDFLSFHSEQPWGHQRALVSCDFNNDSKLDVAWLARNGNEDQVIIRHGPIFSSGQFPSGSSLQVTGTSSEASQENVLSCGDLNGDGYAEVLFGSAIHFFGTAVGVASYPGYNLVGPAGDVNGDGVQDIMAVALDESHFKLFYGPISIGNPGQPSIAYPYDSGGIYDDAKAYLVAAGDVTADGYADILVPNKLGNDFDSIRVYEGKEGTGSALNSFVLIHPGNEQNNSFLHKSKPRGMTTGDFNGDGYLDIAVYWRRLSNNLQGIVVMFGPDFIGWDRAIGPSESLLTPGYGFSIAAADVSGNGRDDLIVLHRSAYGANRGEITVHSDTLP